MKWYRNVPRNASRLIAVGSFVALFAVLAAGFAFLFVRPVHGSGTGGLSQVTLSPPSQTDTIGGGQGLVAATLLTYGTPVSGVALSFRVESGPNAGISGACIPSNCTTDANGQVDWGYFGTALGIDTVQAWLDENGNGTPDAGEPQATASVTWIRPTTTAQSPSWAGYVLTNPPLRSVSALITVPIVPASCASSRYSAFWVGFNGWAHDTNFLPQIGFNADCRAADVIRGTTACGPKTGPAYYLWWELNPHTGLNPICTLHIEPGDRVFASVTPLASQVTLTAFVVYSDGSTSPQWSQTFQVAHASYSSMECIAEDPLAGQPVPFSDFGSVQFDGCSAIRDYRAGSTLQRVDMYTPDRSHSLEATTSPITMSGAVSFTVARVGG